VRTRWAGRGWTVTRGLELAARCWAAGRGWPVELVPGSRVRVAGSGYGFRWRGPGSYQHSTRRIEIGVDLVRKHPWLLGRLVRVGWDGVTAYAQPAAAAETIHGIRCRRAVWAYRLGETFSGWLVSAAGGRTYHARAAKVMPARAAAREAVGAWRRQRAAQRAAALELDKLRDLRARVTPEWVRAHVGYCAAGCRAWAASHRIPAHRVAAGVPVGVLVRRAPRDERVLAVARAASIHP